MMEESMILEKLHVRDENVGKVQKSDCNIACLHVGANH